MLRNWQGIVPTCVAEFQGTGAFGNLRDRREMNDKSEVANPWTKKSANDHYVTVTNRKDPENP
jgi:hypothetical protein